MAVVLIAFLLYAVSAFTAAIASLLWVPRVPQATLAVRALRVGAIAGLFLLALGTGCDNARTVAGLFAANVPSGVFELRNTTAAHKLMAEKYPHGVHDANYILSWFCFVCHECLGGMFVLPGVYLWMVASFLPGRDQTTVCTAPGSCGHCRVVCACANWLQKNRGKTAGGFWSRFAGGLHTALSTTALCALGLALCLLALGIGTAGFITYTATAPLELKWIDSLGLWTWTCGEDHKNPNGLFGVFLSSYVWIAVGVLLWQWRGVTWFVVLQVLSFIGQGVSAVAGEAIILPSNFFEQVVTWALLLMGRKLHLQLQADQRVTGAWLLDSNNV